MTDWFTARSGIGWFTSYDLGVGRGFPSDCSFDLLQIWLDLELDPGLTDIII